MSEMLVAVNYDQVVAKPKQLNQYDLYVSWASVLKSQVARVRII